MVDPGLLPDTIYGHRINPWKQSQEKTEQHWLWPQNKKGKRSMEFH